MRTRHLPLCASLLGLLATGSAEASNRVPVAVAPGAAPGFGVVDTRCPTFHWTPVDGAAAYEIVVLEARRLQADGADLAAGGEREAAAGTASASASLRATLPAAATGWTPSLEQCLDDDADYLWSIRARHSRGWGEWSEPGLFQVRARRESTGDADESLVRRLVREVLEEERQLAAHRADTASTVPVLGPMQDVQGTDTSTRSIIAAPVTRDPRHAATLRTEQSALVASAGLAAHSTSVVDGSAGVHGQSTAASGFVHGVLGTSQSTGGPAIYGLNTAATAPDNQAAGVRGDAYATTGNGVYGVHGATTGTGVGVRGDTLSTTGYGVYGWHNKNSGAGVGCTAFPFHPPVPVGTSSTAAVETSCSGAMAPTHAFR